MFRTDFQDHRSDLQPAINQTVEGAEKCQGINFSRDRRLLAVDG